MVLCHQFTGFSPARLDYPLCLRVNAKFLRCQCNGSKHLMLRVLLPGRDYSLGTYIILKQSKNINYFRKKVYFSASIAFTHSQPRTEIYLSTSTINSENIPDVLIMLPAFSFSSLSTISPFLRMMSLHFLPLFENL